MLHNESQLPIREGQVSLPGGSPDPIPAIQQPGSAVPPVAANPIASQVLITPEQMQQLQELLANVKAKISEVGTAKFGQVNSTDSARKDALREMFTLLQEAGVDLTDPQSVGSFLADMRAKNPQLAQDFEATLNQLLGLESPDMQGVAPTAPVTQGLPKEGLPNNEINNETIPQAVPGPVPPRLSSSQLG